MEPRVYFQLTLHNRLSKHQAVHLNLLQISLFEPSFLHGDIPVKSRAMVVLAKYLVNVNRCFESPIALLEEALKC